jgi:hypothetical protein
VVDRIEVTLEHLQSCHDAELASLAIDRSNETVNVTFVKVDGTKVAFAFNQVIGIRTSDILFQNVVSRLSLSSVTHLPDSDIERVTRWLCSIEDGRPLMEPATVVRFIEEIADGRLFLFHADPSWGAELAILCRSIAFYRP